MDSQVTPNTFCAYTGSTVGIDTTIFFISGNPGLIGYYHPFLSLLAQNLADAEANIPREKSQEDKLSPNYQIYGCNLGGFKIGVSADHDSQREPQGGGKMYNLEEQICFVKQKLAELMRVNATAEENGVSRSSRRKVILIGHSVGAYIAMELLRRHREDTAETPRRSALHSPGSNAKSADFDIVGGVMLFPTIMHIAHSPSGQKLTVSSFLSLCFLYGFVSVFVASPDSSFPETPYGYPPTCPCRGLLDSPPHTPPPPLDSPILDPLRYGESADARFGHDMRISRKPRRRAASFVCLWLM